MSEGTDAVVVEGDETTTDESVTVIVDTTDTESVDGEAVADEMETEREIEHAVDLALLRRDVTDLQQTVAEIQSQLAMNSVVTEAVAETVDDLADAVTEEVTESTDADLDGDGEPDEVPTTARKHWLFRSREDWSKN